MRRRRNFPNGRRTKTLMKFKEGKKLKSNIIDDSFAEEEEDDDEVVDLIPPGSEREKEGIKDARLTLVSMYVSLLTLSIIALILGVIIFDDKLGFSLGLIVGALTGLFYIWHLNKSLKEVLDMSSEMAEKSMRKDALIRLVAIIALDTIICAAVGGYSPVGVLASLLVIKLSFYLSPMWLRVLKAGKFNKGG